MLTRTRQSVRRKDSKRDGEYSEEAELYPIRADIADWLWQTLHADLSDMTEITADSFMADLASGVVLCHLCKHIQRCMLERSEQVRGDMLSTVSWTVSVDEIKIHKVPRNSPFGQAFARDNAACFLAFARSMGLTDAILFTSNGLVESQSPRSVLVAVLEVIRRAAQIGILDTIPQIIEFEHEIEAEEESDKRQAEESPKHAVLHELHDAVQVPGLPSRDEARPRGNQHLPVKKLTRDSPVPSSPPVKALSLDSLIKMTIRECTCESRYPVVKISEGKYLFGPQQTKIFCRVLRNHVMVRVGGGWCQLRSYVSKYDPCRMHGHIPKGQVTLSLSNGQLDGAGIPRTPSLESHTAIDRSSTQSESGVSISLTACVAHATSTKVGDLDKSPSDMRSAAANNLATNHCPGDAKLPGVECLTLEHLGCTSSPKEGMEAASDDSGQPKSAPQGVKSVAGTCTLTQQRRTQWAADKGQQVPSISPLRKSSSFTVHSVDRKAANRLPANKRVQSFRSVPGASVRNPKNTGTPSLHKPSTPASRSSMFSSHHGKRALPFSASSPPNPAPVKSSGESTSSRRAEECTASSGGTEGNGEESDAQLKAATRSQPGSSSTPPSSSGQSNGAHSKASTSQFQRVSRAVGLMRRNDAKAVRTRSAVAEKDRKPLQDGGDREQKAAGRESLPARPLNMHTTLSRAHGSSTADRIQVGPSRSPATSPARSPARQAGDVPGGKSSSLASSAKPGSPRCVSPAQQRDGSTPRRAELDKPKTAQAVAFGRNYSTRAKSPADMHPPSPVGSPNVKRPGLQRGATQSNPRPTPSGQGSLVAKVSSSPTLAMLRARSLDKVDPSTTSGTARRQTLQRNATDSSDSDVSSSGSVLAHSRPLSKVRHPKRHSLPCIAPGSVGSLADGFGMVQPRSLPEHGECDATHPAITELAESDPPIPQPETTENQSSVNLHVLVTPSPPPPEPLQKAAAAEDSQKLMNKPTGTGFLRSRGRSTSFQGKPGVSAATQRTRKDAVPRGVTTGSFRSSRQAESPTAAGRGSTPGDNAVSVADSRNSPAVSPGSGTGPLGQSPRRRWQPTSNGSPGKQSAAPGSFRHARRPLA